jgi:hypothetical protein
MAWLEKMVVTTLFTKCSNNHLFFKEGFWAFLKIRDILNSSDLSFQTIIRFLHKRIVEQNERNSSYSSSR